MAIVKGAKKGKDEARQPIIASDSAQSKTYINILYGLAEGEVEGLANGYQSISLEETPLQDANGNLNFSNVKVDFRKGTNDQDYIEGFPSVDSESAVDIELKSGTPWVRAFNNIDLDAVRIRFKWGPLRKQDATTGDVSGLTIEYAIDLQTDGGTWTEVLKTKISDKTSANYERAHRIDLPKADTGWLIRVRRLTPNSTSEYVSDKMYIEAITEVVDVKLRYPNTALLGIRYDAETFGNVAKVAVDLKGTLILVPTNYNTQTRQYTGMWDGTFKRAYTNNPAWIYYDLCTNDRYGLGSRLTPFMIDKWSLYRLAQYCDQTVADGIGGQEPRFTCNVYLQSAEEAFSILMKLAGVFRAIAFWDGNSINCDADIPQDTYFTYSRANVNGGVFEYSGTRARDRHNVVRVAWDNPANHYKTEYEYVRDEIAIAEAGQVRILELDAWGCTSRGQAQRAGHWALISEQKETRTVSFKVGLDGHIPLPGRVIEIADELFAGRANGGRVSKISTDLKSITLDRDDVVAKAGDRLVINGESGKAQTRIVQSISGRVVTVTLPFDENTIAIQNVWVLDAKDLATMKFRVISITQDEKHQFGITALQYNPQKFDEIDNGAFFEETPISIVNPSIQDPVKDVLITSESRVDQGINIVTMIVSWTQAKGAVKYLVEWRKDDGSWIRLPQTGNNSVEVPGVYSGQYQARVTAISAFEIASLPASSILTDIKGKQGLPPKLAFIRATGILFGMKLDWGFPPTGAKDTAYTEIEVSPDGATNVAQLGLFAYPTTTNTIQGLQPNLRQFYRGRLIDRIGNVGPWSDWTNGITTADPEAVLDLISGHIAETDLAQELQGKIENTVNVAEAAEQAAANAQTAANSAQTAAGEAKTAASNAQSAATSAQAQASTAQQVANDASVIASNAKNTADNASTAASKVASDLITSTNQLNQKIADESSARIAAISNLNDGLTTETTQRKSEDAALLSNIETYKSSTNGTLSSLQTQITTNATNTSANATQINALDSRLTTNESKTNTAISSAATAQTTANTAVTKADAASTSINTLKSTLRVQADSLNIDPHFVSGLEYYTIAEVPAGNSVTHGAFGENGSLGIRVIKSNADTSGGTNTNVNTNRTDGFFLKANNTYRAIVRCKLISGTGSILGRFHNKSDNAVLASATLSVASTSAYVDLIYTYKPTSDVLVYFGTWLMAAGTIDYDSISIINATDAVASDANASAITNLTTRVTNAEGTLTSQGNSITQLNNNIVSINGTLASKADATALSSLANRVTTAEGNISSQGGAITTLQNNVSTINSTLATKADSSALTALNTRVTSNEGTLTSQGNSITSLQNSISNVGVNLVALADQLKTVSMAATTGESYITWSLTDPALKPDTFYTLSFWALRTPNVKSVDTFLIASNGAHHKSAIVAVTTATLTRYSVTFKTNADASGITYSLRFDLNGSSDGNIATLTVQKPQLEEGQVATYWKPSTYDKADASALSTLQNTVTQQGNTLTSNSNAITSLQNNVTSINSVLTTKADATAVSNIDSKVTVIDDKVTSNTSNITSLNNTITNGSLNLVYNTLYNDLSNITANGNHSIAVDSATYARSKVLKVMASGAGQDGVHQILMTATVIPVTSSTEPLVLSFFAKADAALSVKIQLFGGIGAQNIALTTTWTKYTITTLRKSASHVDTTNLYMSLLAAGVAYFTNVQLERGTIATAYSAASTETGNLIAANASALSSLSSTVTQQGNKLTSQGNSITSLNNSLVTTNNNVTTAQNTANNAASAAAAAQNTANTKADASALTALSNTVTTQGNAISSQGSAITSLNNSLNSLAVGSTNLLPGTDLSTHASKDGTFKNGNMISATATTAGSVDMLALKSTVELLAGEYVVSFWAKAETAGTLFNVYFYNPNTTTSGTASNGAITTRVDGQVTFTLTTTMTKYFVKYKQSGNTSKKDVLFRIQAPTSGTYKVWLALPQLEEGNVVTDWSPAVTDIATSAALSSLGSTVTQQGNTLTSQGNSITSLNNSVNTINSTLATKADSSAVNSLDSRVSATEGNINSQSNSITSLNNAIKGAIATAGELIPNPTFVPDYNQMGMTVVATTDSEVPTGCAYQYAARLAARDHIPSINNIACKEGDVFEISALVACATGTAGLTLYVGKASTPTASIGSIASGASATVSSTWTRITWKWTVPANCNYFRPYVSVGQSSPFGTVWFITDWHCKNITAAATAQAKADANATALTTLQNTVTQHGGTLTSQGSQITALNNNITSINGALATKADSSALSALDSRVTATENNLTTTNSSITSLQSAIQSQGDALNLDPNFREGLKFITVGELATGNSIVAGNYGEGGGTGLRVTKANDAGTSGTNPTVKTPTSGVWLKAGRTYRAAVRVRKVSGTTGLLLRWIRASDSATLAPSQVTATDTTNFVDFSLDYTPTSDVLAWFGVWMYPNAGVIDYSSIRLTDRTASLENATTASAVSSLTTRVTNAEGTITSQGNSIVSLNNSVSSINGALATKADNAALSSLDSRVTASENSITSQGSQITSLQAGLSAAAVIGTNLLSNTAVPNSANQPKTSDGTTSLQGFSTNFNIDSYFSINDTSVERFYRMTSPVNAASVLRVNTTYTISADVRGAALPVRWRIIAQVGGAWSDIAVKSMSGISNNQYTRQSCTFTVPANATSLIMSFQSDSTTVGNTLAVRRLKLEVGSAATLWEQPIGEIATSKALSSLDTRVTNAEGTISSQSNSITQLNNSVSNINGVLASKADASALSSLDSKVSVIDGKVSTQASSITTLQTTVGGNTAAIQQVTESVDGVKAQQYLKMDVNGHLAGHGSMNDGTTSTFIFNYDAIQFGAPVGVDGVTPKPIMSLLNTPLTLPNGTVIPRGLYVDSGSFGYINANRIWAENLSTISADLGDIEVDNAHIKNGAIDTLKIQDEAVTVPSGVINQTERKFYFAVSNSMAGSVGYTQDLVTLNVQTQGGKLRIDGSFVFDCKVRITQYSSSYDILKCVTLACRVLVNGTVAYTQEIYPTFYDGNSTIRFIGVTATPVYILPASTGTKTIVLQLAYITKYSNIYYGSFEAQGGFADTPSIITMSSLSTLELKK
ncbi:phage tail family protein [Acinetobacter pittii]|uniref:TipJ family phage tail tip protein n=1 Tax=Acinetobacter pittii TaxID=48296 RepID=UPI00049ED807|nr:phage tail protein [Acinetobacter pittii]KCX60900.1 phage tail family protein [Acinetobacter pittii]PPC00253.1 phage tail protein [Acinetobacter pittii]PPC34513.1 phage tail protein [Acinetobacter pittii]WPP63988.1 phage tail protein [Acinetobacter pittii]